MPANFLGVLVERSLKLPLQQLLVLQEWWVGSFGDKGSILTVKEYSRFRSRYILLASASCKVKWHIFLAWYKVANDDSQPAKELKMWELLGPAANLQYRQICNAYWPILFCCSWTWTSQMEQPRCAAKPRNRCLSVKHTDFTYWTYHLKSVACLQSCDNTPETTGLFLSAVHMHILIIDWSVTTR